jgi:DNA-binding transcriptional LysR family regulator
MPVTATVITPCRSNQACGERAADPYGLRQAACYDAPMTLEQLRVFVAVAERQHVTRAAEALNLAQSAVSSAIAGLEARHQVKLFNRVGRGIELTEAGTLFLIEARAVLARAESAESTLSELGGLKRGTLVVQASQTIASFWLPRHLVAFRRAYPRIDIRLSIGNTAQVAAAIHAGTAELGFVEGEVMDPVLLSQPVARDQIIVVVGPEHPWIGRDSVTPGELADTEWVLREQGSGTRSAFEQALIGFGIAPNSLRVPLELPSNEAVRSAVEAGMGATAISASVAAPSIETGLLYQVPLKIPDRHFHVLHHGERQHSKVAERLLQMIAGQ